MSEEGTADAEIRLDAAEFFSLLLVMVVGITNLWAQSGMKARDTALLGSSWFRMTTSPPRVCR